MKKWVGLLIIMSVLLLAACGKGDTSSSKGTKEKAKSKSGSVEIKIKEGSYAVLPKAAEEGKNTLILKVQVTNKGKKQITVSTDNFALYEKGSDEKIKSELYFDGSKEITQFQFDKLSGGKSITSNVIFNIDPKKKYELSYSPSIVDAASTKSDEDEDIKLPLDLSEYKKSEKAIKNVENAGQAFIDVLFLKKDNSDYDKYVANEKGQTEEKLFKLYKEDNDQYIFNSAELKTEDYKKAMEMFMSAQGKRAKITTKLNALTGDQAEIEVAIEEGLNNSKIQDLTTKIVREYRDDSDEFAGSEKAYKYAFSKYNDILNQVDLKSDNSNLKLKLKKDDGKWKVDLSDEENETTCKALLGNFY